MLVICSNCEARLQLDESKIPSQTFKARCPKCQAGIDVRPPAVNADANAMSLPEEMTPPSPAISPFQRPTVAAPFKPDEQENAELSNQSESMASEVAKLLAAALRHSESGSTKIAPEKRPSWDRRKALVCSSPGCRESVARGLVT